MVTTSLPTLESGLEVITKRLPWDILFGTFLLEFTNFNFLTCCVHCFLKSDKELGKFHATFGRLGVIAKVCLCPYALLPELSEQFHFLSGHIPAWDDVNVDQCQVLILRSRSFLSLFILQNAWNEFLAEKADAHRCWDLRGLIVRYNIIVAATDRQGLVGRYIGFSKRRVHDVERLLVIGETRDWRLFLHLMFILFFNDSGFISNTSSSPIPLPMRNVSTAWCKGFRVIRW